MWSLRLPWWFAQGVALVVHPPVAEVGTRVVVSTQAARPGLAVTLIHAEGERIDLGTTDAGGRLVFVATTPGKCELRASADGVETFVPYEILPGTRRYLLAAAVIPLALALLLINARTLRSDKASVS
jgi:hypothetical protein